MQAKQQVPTNSKILPAQIGQVDGLKKQCTHPQLCFNSVYISTHLNFRHFYRLNILPYINKQFQDTGNTIDISYTKISKKK